MGLFSFLFSKHKLLRTTYEAETFRAVFREDEELFLRVEKGEELKRYRELEEYVNSAQFKESLNSATHIVRNKFKILSNNILPSILPCQKIHLT